MNNFDKAVLTFKFIKIMNRMREYTSDYHKLITKKYPHITESTFQLGERTSYSVSGTEITSKLILKINYYPIASIKLQVQKTWYNETLCLPQRTYIPIVNFDPKYTQISKIPWISHLGASMVYNESPENKFEYDDEMIDLLSIDECKSILNGATEELEFQYSTIHSFDERTMIQFAIISLLTTSNLGATVNVVFPDLSSWADSYDGMLDVLHLLEEGILTV